jgi:hypothetical protein
MAPRREGGGNTRETAAFTPGNRRRHERDEARKTGLVKRPFDDLLTGWKRGDL